MWLGVQPECEPISSLDCSLGPRAALAWWYASLKYRWVMCVTNHLQHFHWTLSQFKGQGTWKQTSDTLWIFKRNFLSSSPTMGIIIHHCFFFLRLTPLSITLMLLLRWHSIQIWPEKHKRRDYFPDLVLLKRIVLHLSMVFCLTGFVCQLAFVRAQQKPRKRKKEKYGRGGRGSLALPDAHLPQRRDKRKSQRVQGTEIIPPFSSPHLSSLFCSPAWQIYRLKLRNWGKLKLLWLPDPQAPQRTAKWAKS